MDSKKGVLILLVILSLTSCLTIVSAERLPVVNSDNSTWGTILNGYLMKIAGENATELNNTMVNGTNIYASTINSTHVIDGSLDDNDLSDSMNITLGQKITFTLGEIIDNIVDGWIRIVGDLNVTGSAVVADELNASVIYQNGSQVITNQQSGWIEYSDNVYNDTNRLTVGTTMVNFSMTDYTTREKELPVGITNLTWFNGTHLLTDNTGNSFLYRWRYKAEPQGVSLYCETFYYIGGSVGQLPMRQFTFPKGSGITQIGTFTNVEYTLDTWAQNGALIQIQCSGDVEFWDMELTIEKLHDGRGIYS